MFGSQLASSGTTDNKVSSDGSGWTVSTGSATKASGGDRVQSGNTDPMSAPAVVVGGNTFSPLALAGIGGALLLVLVVVLTKKRKG